MRNKFDEQLSQLNHEMIEMGALCEEVIALASRALTENDKSLAARVAPLDSEIDRKERDIENLCLKLLLQQQPVARDLRQISAALKMITDIERIGDQASDIAEIVISLSDQNYIKDLVHLKAMGELGLRMARESVESFIKNDAALADRIIAADDEMDELFCVVKDELIELIKADSGRADQAIAFMMIAKYLERIGDHAVNVCEWTKYFETGVHIKY